MKTLILTLCMLLLPCVAWAGAVRIPTEYDPKANILWIDISETLKPAIPCPMTMELQNDTETLAIIDRGKLIIQHGCCEKLGLKHAWIIEEWPPTWGITQKLQAVKAEPILNSVWYKCLNCGLSMRKKSVERNEYEYR